MCSKSSGGGLQQKLDEHNLFDSTNLLVLSDHGLQAIDGEEQFFIEECLADYSKIRRIVNSHSLLMVFVDPEEEDAVSDAIALRAITCRSSSS